MSVPLVEEPAKRFICLPCLAECRQRVSGFVRAWLDDELSPFIAADRMRPEDGEDASVRGALAGFVSSTPPEAGDYSIDKYLRCEDFPALRHEQLYEVRLLTVTSRFRGREITCTLM